jgi:hypothetical protein
MGIFHFQIEFISSRCGLDDSKARSLLGAFCEKEDLVGLELDFGWSKITKKSFELLYNQLRTKNRLKTIEYLSLQCERSELSRDTVYYIGKTVEACENLNHLTLGFSGNTLGSRGYWGILKKSESLSRLVSLKLIVKFPDFEGDDGREFASAFSGLKHLKQMAFHFDVYTFMLGWTL